MNALPDEVLEPILQHAMERPIPLVLQHFLGHKHLRDYDTGGLEWTTLENESPDPYLAWQHHQEPHRQDWALAGVCRRWRPMAKHAFFTRKVLATDVVHADHLAKLKLPGLSHEDQELALALVRHIIFFNIDLRDAKELSIVPRCVAPFRQLQRVDFALGFMKGNGGGTRHHLRLERREKPLSEFVDHLTPLRSRTVLGLTLDQVDIGWFPGTLKPHVIRKQLTRFVYPGLERMALTANAWEVVLKERQRQNETEQNVAVE